MKNNKVKSKITERKGRKSKGEESPKLAPFIPFTPFDFTKIKVNDIVPNNAELWSFLMSFKYKEIFCFVPSELVCCAPTRFQIKIDPKLAIHSKVMPMSYWAIGLYIPEIQYYLFQYQNIIFGPNQVIEGEITTIWVDCREALMDNLLALLELYEEHDRIPLSISHKLGADPSVAGFYYILLGALRDLNKIYQKKYELGGWPELQKEYFSKSERKKSK